MAIKDFLKNALSDDKGNPSSLRLNIFIGFTQWSLAITAGFIWVLWVYPYLILGYLATLAALTGGLVGLKVYQKKAENTTTSDDPVVIDSSNNTATTEEGKQ